jgi:acyl-coenzyme A thioesterase PaaI-like protein
MHGGMISAILDETIGRTIWIHEPDCWGVTIDLQIKYRNPVPVNEPLMAIAEMTESKSRIFKGSGIIAKMDGTVLAEGKGIFYKIKLDQIDANSHEGEAVFFVPDDVKEIAIEHIKLKKT